MACPAGECGSHSYPNITKSKTDAIVAQLRANGATVTGEAPQWNVDTHRNGVKLCGFWDAGAMVLTVTVTDMDWYVPCSKVWENIDPLMNNIRGFSEETMMSILTKMMNDGIALPEEVLPGEIAIPNK